MITAAQLSEIRTRADRATAGPWSTERPRPHSGGFAGGAIVAATAPRQGIYADPPGGCFPEADRQFIAAARTDVPALLAEVDRLRGKYEAIPTACGAGHSNNLPLALWTCPTCHEEIFKAALAVAMSGNPSAFTSAVTALRDLLTRRGALGWPGQEQQQERPA